MNVKLPAKTFVDLYAATGFTVGTKLKVKNLTPDSVRLFSTAAEPLPTDDHYPCEFRECPVTNEDTDLGAWAMSVTGGGVDVQEVV